MEAFEFLKHMDKLSPEFLANPGTQQQMKNFWSMLDEMATNNPEVNQIQEYSKFIKKNLETGMEEIKADSGKEQVSGTFSFCIKTYTDTKKEIVIINVSHSPK